MIIIAGLGNPTKEYEGTRHNVGFQVIDKIAEKYNIAVDAKKGRAYVGKGIIEGQKVLLVKPQTYMNLSGESIRELVDYFKVDSKEELLVNIAGGIRLNEPAADLGIVMAIASSYKNRPIDEDTIVFGEVGLSGEVRAVTMPEQRVSEAKKLGFKRCIVPAVSMKTIGKMEGIEILGVENVNQAMNLV